MLSSSNIYLCVCVLLCATCNVSNVPLRPGVFSEWAMGIVHYKLHDAYQILYYLFHMLFYWMLYGWPARNSHMGHFETTKDPCRHIHRDISGWSTPAAGGNRYASQFNISFKIGPMSVSVYIYRGTHKRGTCIKIYFIRYGDFFFHAMSFVLVLLLSLWTNFRIHVGKKVHNINCMSNNSEGHSSCWRMATYGREGVEQRVYVSTVSVYVSHSYIWCRLNDTILCGNIAL